MARGAAVAGRRRETGAAFRRRRVRTMLVAALLALGAWPACPHAADDALGQIERIELKTEAAATKVIVMLSRPLAFDVTVLDGEATRQNERRLVLDFPQAALAPAVVAPVKVDDGYVRQIRTGVPSPGNARIVLDLAIGTTHTVEAYETPPHVTIAIRATTDAPEAAPAAHDTDVESAAHPTAAAAKPTPRAPRPKPTPTPHGKPPAPHAKPPAKPAKPSTKAGKPKPQPTKTPAKPHHR